MPALSLRIVRSRTVSEATSVHQIHDWARADWCADVLGATALHHSIMAEKLAALGPWSVLPLVYERSYHGEAQPWIAP